MLNKAILIGRLVMDPELKTTPTGTNVCTFRVAVDRPFQSKGEERKSDFFTIVAWRQTAEFVSRFFQKGRMIGLEGSIQNRDYQDRDGNKRYVTEIVADRAFFVDSKKDAGEGDSYKPAYAQGGASGTAGNYAQGSNDDFQIVSDDDLPF